MLGGFGGRPAPTGHMRRPDHLADHLVWRLRSVLFAGGGNRTSCSVHCTRRQQSISLLLPNRTSSGKRKVEGRHSNNTKKAFACLASRPCQDEGRQTDCSLPAPFSFAHNRSKAAATAAHTKCMFCSVTGTEGGPLWGLLAAWSLPVQ